MSLFRRLLLPVLALAALASAHAEPRPNIEAVQRALQERYQKFLQAAAANNMDVQGNPPAALSFPARLDGTPAGAYPEDCFYDEDLVDPVTGKVNRSVAASLILNLVNNYNGWIITEHYVAPWRLDSLHNLLNTDPLTPIPSSHLVSPPAFSSSDYIAAFETLVAKIAELRHPYFYLPTASSSGSLTEGPLRRDGSTWGAAELSCSAMKNVTELSWADPANHGNFPSELLGRAEFAHTSTSNGTTYYSGYLRTVTGRHVLDSSPYKSGTYRIYERQTDYALLLGLYLPNPFGMPWGSNNTTLAGTSAPYTSYNRLFLATNGTISTTPYQSPLVADVSTATMTPACPPSGSTNRFGWCLERVVVFSPNYEHNVTEPYIDCSGCPTCTSSGCVLGKTHVKLGSLHLEIGLGKDSKENTGNLILHQDSSSLNMAHPFELRWTVQESAELIRSTDYTQALRQLKTPQGLVNILPTEPFKTYEMRFYDTAGVGAKGSNGLYAINSGATPYKTVTVQNPDVAWTKTSTSGLNPSFWQASIPVPGHGLPPSNILYDARLVTNDGTLLGSRYTGTSFLPTSRYKILSHASFPNALFIFYWNGSAWAQDNFSIASSTTTITVSDASVFNQLKITETGGAHSKEWNYQFGYNSGTTTASWTLEHLVNNAVKKTDYRQEVFDFGHTVNNNYVYITERTTDGLSQTVSKTSTTRRVFAWNRTDSTWDALLGETVSQTLDPDGVALTTTSDYYSDSVNDGNNYGRLKETVRPDGGWERYQYDAQGRTTRVYRSYLNSAPSWDYAGNEVVDYTYGISVTLPDSTTGTMTQTVTTQDNQEVSRSYRITSEDTANALQVTHDIRAKNTGALWNDATNLVTKTWTHAGGAYDGRTARVLNPDGTATLYAYSLNATIGEETVTMSSGVPDSTLSTITRGTKTVSVTNAQGGQVSTDTYDIGTSGETLVASADGFDFDEFGRPGEIHYLDGTVHYYNFGCCGLQSETDREGVTTTYTRDEEERPLTATRAGVTTETIYDVLGRARTVKRYPAGQPGSAITVSETGYDVAGRVSFTRSFGRETGIVETPQPTLRKTTRVTTLPYKATWTPAERGSVTEVTWADGRTEREIGTAAAARRYTYGTATLAEATDLGYNGGTRFQTVTEILLDETGADTDEQTTSYLDPLGRTVKLLHADNATSFQAYNNVGQLIWQKDADGVLSRLEYDALGELNLTILDMDRLPGWSYTSTDRITRTTREVATRTDGSTSTPVQRVKTEVWLTDGQDTPKEISVTDVSLDGLTSWKKTNGLTTKTVTVFNAGTQTRTETTTNPDKTSIVRVFVNGRLDSETRKDKANITVSSATYGYDAHGRQNTVTDSLGRVTTTVYHADDQINTITSPDPDTTKSGTGYDAQTTTYLYDEAGRVRSVAQHDGATTETTYWGNGKVKRVSGGRIYPQAYTYDAQARVKTLTTWQDFAGQTEAAVTTWNYHPERGWLESKEYNDGKGPSYQYTSAGRLWKRTWARIEGGQPVLTTCGYNNAGELNSITYSDSTPAVAHTYDRGGRLLTTTDAAGMLTRSYDPVSLRLAGENYSGTGVLSGRSIARSYDLLQRPQSLATDGGYSLGYSYDAAGRLEILNQGFHSATFGYETGTSLHNRTTVKRVGVARASHDRNLDAIGRIAGVTTTVGGSAVVARSYGYNHANHRTGVELEDTRRWAYGYDSIGQVNSAQKRLADNSTPLPGYTFGYTFDDIGNRTQTVTNGRTASYDANLLNQYDTRVVSGAFDVRGEAHTNAVVTVDTLATTRTPIDLTRSDFYRELSVANGTSAVSQDLEIEAVRTSPVESAIENRPSFLAQTPESFANDDDGNLKQDGRWDYYWDAENRLIRMETRANIAAAFPDLKTRLTFRYDAQGRRISKTVEDWNPAVNGGLGGWVETLDLLFIYDGWNLLTELDANNSNALIRSHAWGLDLSGSTQGAGGVGGLLWTSTPTHSFTAAHDGNGNIVAWINTGTLAVSGRSDYGAFGETVMQTGVAKGLPFGFSTKYFDSEAELHYYGHRYYARATGSWLSRDPLEEEQGGANLYGFVFNNPISLIDPLGLQTAPPPVPTTWNGPYLNSPSSLGGTAGTATGIGVAGTAVVTGLGAASVVTGNLMYQAYIEPVIDDAFNIDYGANKLKLSPQIFELLSDQLSTTPTNDHVVAPKKRFKCELVVIGENMKRVKPAALAFRAKYYQPWTIKGTLANGRWDSRQFNLALERNRRWIRGQMSTGKIILDIGINQGQRRRSVFYLMETQETASYPLKFRIPWPASYETY